MECNTISLHAFIFRTLPFPLLLLTNSKTLWSPDSPYPGGCTLPKPYYRSFITCLLPLLPCFLLLLFLFFFFFFFALFCLFIYYSFSIFCFILNRIFISTNTVRTEVAKTAKSEFHCIFVCYFVVPSAAVGKYKERSLTAKTQLTKPTNH